MSMGALVSRSSSNSSTSIIRLRPTFVQAESARRALGAQGRRTESGAICCGLRLLRGRSCGFLRLRRGSGGGGLELGEPRRERLVFLAGGDGDRLHRLELL